MVRASVKMASKERLAPDHRTPYHRFGPEIQRLQRKAEEGNAEFNEALNYIQYLRSQVLPPLGTPFTLIRRR